MRRSMRESVLSRVDVSDSVGSYSPDNSDVLPKASTLRMKVVAQSYNDDNVAYCAQTICKAHEHPDFEGTKRKDVVVCVAEHDAW